MGKKTLIIYTLFCLVVGGLLSDTISRAGGGFATKYYKVYELGAPKGFRACAGMSFYNEVTKGDVFIEWKGPRNFVVYIEE